MSALAHGVDYLIHGSLADLVGLGLGHDAAWSFAP